jgi:hypothetical protein
VALALACCGMSSIWGEEEEKKTSIYEVGRVCLDVLKLFFRKTLFSKNICWWCDVTLFFTFGKKTNVFPRLARKLQLQKSRPKRRFNEYLYSNYLFLKEWIKRSVIIESNSHFGVESVNGRPGRNH